MAVPAGPQKSPSGVDVLLRWGVTRLAGRLDGCRTIHSGFDALGPYAVLTVAAEPRAAKRACLAIENGHSAARLLDLDVYGPDAVRVGRINLGEPARRCLLCEQPAADCIRINRHSLETLLEHVGYLLETFHSTLQRLTDIRSDRE